MIKRVYESAFASLAVQFLIGIICLIGIFYKVDIEDRVLNEILILETIVQFVEFVFYIWLVAQYHKLEIDISIARYFDWFFTTPAMLFSLISFMIYYAKTQRGESTENLTLRSIYSENNDVINSVLLYNALMLIIGFLGEVKIIARNVAFVIGSVFLFMAFYLIYANFTQHDTLITIVFAYNLIVWSGYGIGYMMSYENKNIAYNILDIFAKNIQGLLILGFIIYKYSD